MNELFLETKSGSIPIDSAIVERNHLKKGTLSPFTGNRIVGKNGDFQLEVPIENNSPLNSLKNQDDGIDEMENGLALSTSEMLDIAAGVDSSMQ